VHRTRKHGQQNSMPKYKHLSLGRGGLALLQVLTSQRAQAIQKPFALVVHSKTLPCRLLCPLCLSPTKARSLLGVVRRDVSGGHLEYIHKQYKIILFKYKIIHKEYEDLPPAQVLVWRRRQLAATRVREVVKRRGGKREIEMAREVTSTSCSILARHALFSASSACNAFSCRARKSSRRYTRSSLSSLSVVCSVSTISCDSAMLPSSPETPTKERKEK
jgi:hypothetical protein